MKINEALARIDAGWVRKPRGFRVRFDVYVDGRWESDYSPEEDAAPLDSDVTAWRLAWKLAQANNPEPPDFRDGDLANITVVNSPIPVEITDPFCHKKGCNARHMGSSL